MVDTAVQSTPPTAFVPLPGAIEESFNLSPIEEPEALSSLQDEEDEAKVLSLAKPLTTLFHFLLEGFTRENRSQVQI